jgi:hypothetical protein
MNSAKINHRSYRTPLFFGLIVFAVSAFLRIPYLKTAAALNPDEGELLATAKLASHSWFAYQNYTTPTFGPTWPTFLSFFRSIGINLNFQDAHIISFSLLIFSLLAFQMADLVRRDGSRTYIYLLYGLIDFAVLYPTSPEFAFLSTESLPLALFTLASIFLLKKKRSHLDLYLSGIISALGVLAKYQSFPLMMILIFYIIFYRNTSKEQNWKDLSRFVLAAFAAFVSVIAWVAIGGGLHHFFIESLDFSALYARGNISGFGGGADPITKLQIGVNLIWGQAPIFTALIITLILTFLVNHRTIPNKLKQLQPNSTKQNFPLILATIFIGLVTISAPGNSFPHYLLFFAWSLQSCSPWMIFSSDTSFKEQRSKYWWNQYANLIVISLVIAFIFLPNQSNIFGTVRQSKINEINSNKNLLTRLNALKIEGLGKCPNGSQVFIYGWSSEYYTYFDWNPEDSLVNDPVKMLIGFNVKGIQNRILGAIASKQTKCIFEAIGPNYFSNISPLDSIENRIPTAKELLLSSYKKVELDPNLGIVWVRN